MRLYPHDALAVRGLAPINCRTICWPSLVALVASTLIRLNTGPSSIPLLSNQAESRVIVSDESQTKAPPPSDRSWSERY